jgi:hypothetical protein
MAGSMREVRPTTAAAKWPARPSCGKPGASKKRLPGFATVLVPRCLGRLFCGVNRLKLKKVHSLTGRITPEVMHAAFKAVKRNRGAAGIDKVSISMFEANLQENLDALMRHLKTRGAFKPHPLRRVHIPKGQGKTRPLGIPAVRDRVAQEVVRRLLSPIFEPLFHEDSFGFRPERSCHQALERVLALWREGHKVVLDADIQGFFDNIPHSVITSMTTSWCNSTGSCGARRIASPRPSPTTGGCSLRSINGFAFVCAA